MNYNKLIAEFMGVVFHDDENQYYNADGLHIGNTLQYHTSWDWLMPVVRKIENENELIGAHILSTDRDKTYKKVVGFIKDQACHIELQEWEKNNQ